MFPLLRLGGLQHGAAVTTPSSFNTDFKEDFNTDLNHDRTLITLRRSRSDCVGATSVINVANKIGPICLAPLTASEESDDSNHVIVPYLHGELWGAFSHNSIELLGHCLPVFKTYRELLMSYYLLRHRSC